VKELLSEILHTICCGQGLCQQLDRQGADDAFATSWTQCTTIVSMTVMGRSQCILRTSARFDVAHD
jgi:hypothetical protein